MLNVPQFPQLLLGTKPAGNAATAAVISNGCKTNHAPQNNEKLKMPLFPLVNPQNTTKLPPPVTNIVYANGNGSNHVNGNNGNVMGIANNHMLPNEKMVQLMKQLGSSGFSTPQINAFMLQWQSLNNTENAAANTDVARLNQMNQWKYMVQQYLRKMRPTGTANAQQMANLIASNTTANNNNTANHASIVPAVNGLNHSSSTSSTANSSSNHIVLTPTSIQFPPLLTTNNIDPALHAAAPQMPPLVSDTGTSQQSSKKEQIKFNVITTNHCNSNTPQSTSNSNATPPNTGIDLLLAAAEAAEQLPPKQQHLASDVSSVDDDEDDEDEEEQHVVATRQSPRSHKRKRRPPHSEDDNDDSNGDSDYTPPSSNSHKKRKLNPGGTNPENDARVKAGIESSFCTLCHRTSQKLSRYNWIYHLRSPHLFGCEQCERRFTKQSYLDEHVDTEHKHQS